VVIPKALAVEVLLKTEEIVKRENGMRADLSKGITVSEVYKKHGKFWNEKWMGLRPGRD
jgi:4-hydroxy-4-methyl-2-oxoglutarate aldolase